MVFTVICALILIDEAAAYSTAGLIWVISSVALMIAGIQIMICKNRSTTAEEPEIAATTEEKLLGLRKTKVEDAHESYLLDLFTQKRQLDSQRI